MKKEHFTSRTAVILAFAGSAIGLGNLWRFPYMVGEYGGAAFILTYIVACFVLSIPVFLAEAVIGRSTGKNAVGAIKEITDKPFWKIFGYLSILTPLIICSYYSVVGGWSLDFLARSAVFQFNRTDPVAAEGIFGTLISGTWAPLLCHFLFLTLACLVLSLGVKDGIGKFSKTCMPILFIMVVAIAAFSISLPGSHAGIDYLLRPDFSKISAKTFAYALGQAFYSLSLGMGINITYSSYIEKKEKLSVTAAGTAIADLVFALIAGFAIMPAVFAAGIQPSAGPGLLFQTLPYIFSSASETVPIIASIVSILFFLSILIAALTSAISLLEVGIAWLVEEKGWSRKKAIAAVFSFCWLIGIFCSLSFGDLSGLKIFGNTIFEALDKFCSNFLLIIGGFLTAVLVGWKMDKEKVFNELTQNGEDKKAVRIFNLVYYAIKYVAPIAIGIIFLTNFIA